MPYIYIKKMATRLARLPWRSVLRRMGQRWQSTSVPAIQMTQTGQLMTNTYILTAPGGYTWLVDPGGHSKQMSVAIKEMLGENGADGENLLIVLTHGHYDHYLGVPGFVNDFPECKVAAPKEDVDRLIRLDPAANLFAVHEYMNEDEIWSVSRKDGEWKVIDGKEDEEHMWKILALPGHTTGHIGLYSKAQNVLISGDVLFASGIGRTDLPGGDYATLMHSIQDKIMTLPENTMVLPGHGPTTTVQQEKKHNMFLR